MPSDSPAPAFCLGRSALCLEIDVGAHTVGDVDGHDVELAQQSQRKLVRVHHHEVEVLVGEQFERHRA